jgi:hypothetical protein
MSAPAPAAGPRPRPRALTRRQERLFFGLAFALGALLQLAVVL